MKELNHVVLEKSFNIQQNEHILLFSHAGIIERRVPAKIFSKFFCYFWFQRNQHSEQKLIPTGWKKVQIFIFLIRFPKNL